LGCKKEKSLKYQKNVVEVVKKEKTEMKMILTSKANKTILIERKDHEKRSDTILQNVYVLGEETNTTEFISI
jgi:3-polyprenyl-4-hydroxybenzoate decarboxylase